jgi:hypothetical protein
MDGGRREPNASKRGRDAFHDAGEEDKRDDELAKKLIVSVWTAAIGQVRALAPTSTSKHSKVELEVKLGHLNEEGQFLSSLSEAEFTALERALRGTFSWVALPEKRSTDVVVGGSSSGEEIRLSFDDVNGLQEAVNKRRISNSTTKISSNLAMRVSLSVETVVAPPTGCSQGMTREQLVIPVRFSRRKIRKTFFHQSGRCVFQLDLTRVETEDVVVATFEMELEFLPWALNDGCMNEHYRQVWAGAIVEFVKSAVVGQINETSFPMFESFYVRKADERNTPHLFDLKTLFLRHFGNINQSVVARATSCEDLKGLSFPGTLPKPLTRSSIHAVVNYDGSSQFRVSEKTDGSRFFMLVLSPCSAHAYRGVYLIDRNLDFFQIDSEVSLLSDFCSNFAGKGATLLDGEVVLTPRYESGENFYLGFGVPIFIVFDILAQQGSFLCDEPLAVREKALFDVIAQFSKLERESRKKLPSNMRNLVYFPFFINRKKLFPLSELAQLSLLLSTSAGDRIYLERDGGCVCFFF